MREPFWQRVINLQKAHRISIDSLALYIGISPSTFKGWIYKDRIPIATHSCDIADALGVSVEYLVRGKDGTAQEKRMRQVQDRKAAAVRIKKLAIALGNTAEQLK